MEFHLNGSQIKQGGNQATTQMCMNKTSPFPPQRHSCWSNQHLNLNQHKVLPVFTCTCMHMHILLYGIGPCSWSELHFGLPLDFFFHLTVTDSRSVHNYLVFSFTVHFISIHTKLTFLIMVDIQTIYFILLSIQSAEICVILFIGIYISVS